MIKNSIFARSNGNDVLMKDLRLFTIQYVGLKEGEHNYHFDIDRSFFDHFDFEDFNDINAFIALKLVKKATLMEFYFELSGSINVNCDVTNEPYDEPLQDSFELVVKFGQEFNDEHEEILILPYGEYEVNIAQYIYELIVLSIPNKRVHPGVADGSLKSDILNKLDELSVRNQNDQETNTIETDPRWDELKKLLTDK